MKPTSSTFLHTALSLEAAPDRVAALNARLGALYALSQTNPCVFASPVGPLRHGSKSLWLPRFVYFGPHAHDGSWRLAFLSGFDGGDLRAINAVLGAIEMLAADVENGHGLNLTFLPVIDAAGISGADEPRRVRTDNWNRTTDPALSLLAREVRTGGFHGFVRVETGLPQQDIVTICVRAPNGFVSTGPDVEIVASDAFDNLDVRFERDAPSADAIGGPLDLAEDLGVQPFELILRIPPSWSDREYEAAATHVLTRFIHRYRAFQAYGGEL